jgi:thymidylate synthase ThyX
MLYVHRFKSLSLNHKPKQTKSRSQTKLNKTKQKSNIFMNYRILKFSHITIFNELDKNLKIQTIQIIFNKIKNALQYFF